MAAYFSPSKTYEWLNPEPLYGVISTAAGFMSAVIPVVVAFVFITRYFQESASQLTGKARFNEALGGITQNVVLLFAYSVSGFLLLELALALAAYFYQQGSFSLVAGVLNDLYEMLKAKTKDYDAVAYESLLDVLISAGAAPLSFIFFHAMSALLTILMSFMRIGYAMFFGFIYLWGFVAIPTAGLSGAMNLKSGWTRSIIALVIWPIVEAMMLMFIYALMLSISAKMISVSGTPVAIFTSMHIMMGIICILLMVVMVAAPYMAARLSMNQEALTGLMNPLVAGALAAGHYTNKIFGGGSGGGGGDGGETGGRNRDKIGAALKNLNENTVGNTVGGAWNMGKKAVSGLGNAVSNMKPPSGDK